MNKISIYNNKGGVAKTTSVINIAYSMALKNNKKVLVVDCDSQENCQSFFYTEKAEKSMDSNYTNIKHTVYEDYLNLTKKKINSFDYVLFDLPPALNDEVKTIIKESDKIFVPTILGEFEIAGLKKVTDEVGDRLGGIFVTMYNKDNDAEIITQFRNILQDRILKSVIPFSKTVRESLKEGLSLEEYFVKRGVPRIFKNSWNIVNAYNALTEEIIQEVES